jgi:DedD protein
MDEALKARLIGAAVLVAIAVLLIPELLSGRKSVEPVTEEAGPRGSRTFTIELGGGAGQSVRTPTTVTTAPAPLPGTQPPAATVAAPVAEPAAPAETTPPPAEVAAAPVEHEPVPPPAAEPSVVPPTVTPPGGGKPASPPASAPSRGGWAVQVGAFGTADAAAKLVRDLSGAGYRAFVSPVARGGKTLHRVRVGPEADKGDAEQLAGRLKARGLPATVVQND